MENGLKVIILLKTIVFSLAMAITGYLGAVIPTVEVWKNGENYLYLLSDVHLDFEGGENTLKQHQDILRALQQKKDESFILVEDSASLLYNALTKLKITTSPPMPASLKEEISIFDWNQDKIENTEYGDQPLYQLSPLLYLSNTCKNNGIRTCNVECNSCLRFYNMGIYTQNNLDGQQYVFDTLSEYVNDLRDCNKLSAYCSVLDQRLTRLQSMINQADHASFKDAASGVRFVLVDAAILYFINTTFKNITHGYVVAGASHIKGIKHHLPYAGYKHLATIGLPMTNIEDTTFNKYALKNPLDLRKTFTEIFNEQKPLWQKAVTYLAGVWMKIR